MSNHKCRGLSNCATHPGWHVIKSSDDEDPWEVYAPFSFFPVETAPTQEKAFAYADAQARKYNAVTSE